MKLVEEGRFRLRHGACRRRGTARPKRHAEAHDAAEPVGPEERRVPGDRRASVVADDDAFVRAERVEDADHVGATAW